MYILRNDEAQTWELQPTTSCEVEVLTSILCVLKHGQKMKYCGVRSDDQSDPLSLHFNAGGKPVKITKLNEHGGGIIYTKWTGGVTWWLTATDDDRDELWAMRDTCYVGSGGLIFLETHKHELGYSLIFTAKYCKICGAPMIRMSRCEWSTCTTCTEKCEHEWERGHMHGAGIDIGVGSFCGKCGIANPGDDEFDSKSPFEHALAVEQELGTIVFHKDLGMTATQVKEALDQAS